MESSVVVVVCNAIKLSSTVQEVVYDEKLNFQTLLMISVSVKSRYQQENAIGCVTVYTVFTNPILLFIKKHAD